MPVVIAIDGGGTKTHVLISSIDNQVLGEGSSGPASLAVSPPEIAKANVNEALGQALASLSLNEPIAVVAMGLAGVNTPTQINAAKELFKPLFTQFNIDDEHFILVNDVEIALANGSVAPDAIALIAGTGSNCWGHNQAGETAKAGGVDYLLSDEGSGYALGLAALKAATKSADGRLQPPSTLQALVFEHFGVQNLQELQDKIYHPPLTKTQVAELSPVVQTAKEQSDAMATGIINQAIADWMELVTAVAARLHLESQPTDLVLAGSLTTVPVFYDAFQMQITQKFPQMKLIRPGQPPVYGAFALARNMVQPPADTA